MQNFWKAALLLPLLVTAAMATDVALDTAAEVATTSPADLTGVWNLDEHASDDLAGQLEVLGQQLMADQGGDRPEPGFGSEDDGVGMPSKRRGGGGPGGRGRTGGQARDGGAAQARGPRELAQAMEQLLITVDAADVEIMDGTDVTRIWTPGGKPVQREGPGGEVVEQAWWEKDVLVLSTNGGRLVITRRLHLADEGKTLIADVTVKVSGTSQRIDAKLVYAGY